MEILDQLKFDSNGLIVAIVQDDDSNEVLMVAYMNREAVQKTLVGDLACFWSRSRQKFWIKGETSGHMQMVRSVSMDCDGAALLVKVKQEGGACHEGYRSCFFREIGSSGGQTTVISEKVFEPDQVYTL